MFSIHSLGFTRDLFINGVLADATHYGGRPAAEGQYAQARLVSLVY